MDAPYNLDIVPTQEVLDYTPKPDDPNAHLKAMNYLNRFANFAYRYPDWASRMVTCIETTDLSQAPMTDTDWKTYQVLYQTHPDLFSNPPHGAPTVKVKIGALERDIPKNHLLIQGEMMHKMLKFGGQESSNVIHLVEVENYDESVANALLTYLEKGNIDITDENCIPLVQIANLYDIDDLKSQVISYLSQNIQLENLHEVLQLAIDLNLQSLISGCLGLAISKSHLLDLIILSNGKRLIEADTEPAKLIRKITALGNVLEKDRFNVIATWDSKRQERIVSVATDPPYSKFNDTTLNAINELCEYLPVQLSLNQDPIDDEALKQILNKLPNLQNLEVFGTEVTTINCNKATKSIECRDCTNLTSIMAPSASYVNCFRCRKLNQDQIKVPKEAKVFA